MYVSVGLHLVKYSWVVSKIDHIIYLYLKKKTAGEVYQIHKMIITFTQSDNLFQTWDDLKDSETTCENLRATERISENQ